MIEKYITYTGFTDHNKDRSVLKDVMGRYRTNLFYEFNKARQADYPPLYTMRETEWLGLTSAYQVYMHSESEYEAALKLVGSWQHWQRLCKSKPFMEGEKDGGQWVGLQSWRDEKEVRDKALAYNQLQVNAATGNVQAQKMIFEGNKDASKRGRPSKAEIAKAAKEQIDTAETIKNDLKRIRLAVDNDNNSRKTISN